MSNLSGYSDYDGPTHWRSSTTAAESAVGLPTSAGATASPLRGVGSSCGEDASSSALDLEETNPLQVGFWREGDSLAPPCGCTITTIHALLEFARVSALDVLYDLGCGDGRICLEACARIHCRSVGVEVEADLVERARHLVSAFCDNNTELDSCRPIILHTDLRVVLERLVAQAKDPRSPVPGGAADENAAADTERDGGRRLPTPSVIVLFLLPEAIADIEGHLLSLLRLIPHLRIVCNSWGLPSLRPDKTVDVSESNGGTSTLHLYSADSLRSSSVQHA